MKSENRFKALSNIHIEESTEKLENYPTRLEHSYYNDNVYWSLAPINLSEVDTNISNTTIHPRISWKETDSITVLPDPIHDRTSERKWVFPTTPTTTVGTFPFELLTHAYDTYQQGDGSKCDIDKL